MRIGRRTALSAAKLAVGLALVAVILYFVDLPEVLRRLATIGAASLLLLFLVFVADRLLMAYKWGLLLQASGTPVGLIPLLKAYFYGSFAGTILPASVGGDVVRFCALLPQPVPREALVASMIVEKVLGFLAVSGLTALAGWRLGVSVLRSGGGTGVGLSVVGASLTGIGLVVAFTIMIRSSIWERIAQRHGGKWGLRVAAIVEGVRLYTRSGRVIATFFGLTCLEQLLPVVGMAILARSLDIRISPVDLFSVVIISLFLARMPISIAGIGIQEGTYVALFLLLGLTAEEGLALSIGARALDIVLPLPIILVFFSETMQSIRQARGRSWTRA